MRSTLLAGLVFGVLGSTAWSAPWRDPSSHTVAFVAIEQGVALEVLDWGGSGPPIVLLAGLGNTAHVFDDFAAHLVDRFHVIGITRRGYGASSHPESGYDISSLATDVRMVCDALHLDRVTFVGHSLAGDEMTKFAATWPSRVQALVYLDAAYDRSQMPPEGTGPQQSPTPDDLISLDTFGEYALRTTGSRRPEADTRWSVVTDADGHLLRGAIPSTTPQAIMRALERPDYVHVTAPALAIYQPHELRYTFPDYAHFDDENKRRAEAMMATAKPWVEHSIGQFRDEVRNGRVVVLKTGTHYVFLTNEEEVVRLIRDFLR